MGFLCWKILTQAERLCSSLAPRYSLLSCPRVFLLSLLIMGFFEKFVFLADMIGFFLVTRYPYFDLFCMLMKEGRSTESYRGVNKAYTPSTSIFSMQMLRENFEVYLHGSIYFVCATGMTLDIGRRNCGLVSAFHIVYLAISSCFENKQWSEFMMVRNSSFHDFLHLSPSPSPLLYRAWTQTNSNWQISFILSHFYMELGYFMTMYPNEC